MFYVRPFSRSNGHKNRPANVGACILAFVRRTQAPSVPHCPYSQPTIYVVEQNAQSKMHVHLCCLLRIVGGTLPSIKSQIFRTATCCRKTPSSCPRFTTPDEEKNTREISTISHQSAISLTRQSPAPVHRSYCCYRRHHCESPSCFASTSSYPRAPQTQPLQPVSNYKPTT